MASNMDKRYKSLQEATLSALGDVMTDRVLQWIQQECTKREQEMFKLGALHERYRLRKYDVDDEGVADAAEAFLKAYRLFVEGNANPQEG